MSVIGDSLNIEQENLEKALEQARLDSAKQVRIDSTKLANQAALKKKAEFDSLQLTLDGVEELEDYIKDKNKIIHGPILSSVIDDAKLQEGIVNLTRDLVQYEATTNVQDDYDDFINMYNELAQIHEAYQSLSYSPGAFGLHKGEGEWQFGMAGGAFGIGGRGPAGSPAPVDIYGNAIPGQQGGMFSAFLLNEENLRFRDMNGLDKIFGDVLVSSEELIETKVGTGEFYYKLITGEDNRHMTRYVQKPSDQDLQRVTLSRLFAGDEEIRKLIYGTNLLDPTEDKVAHLQGFKDIVDYYKLGGPTGIGSGENLKWFFNNPVGMTNLLTESLIAKQNGKNYFEEGIQTDTYLIFEKALQHLPTEQRQAIGQQLQGIQETIGGSAYFDKFNKLKERFGIDEMTGNIETPGVYHGINPLEDPKYRHLQDKKDNLFKAVSSYERLTGKKYDVMEALNLLSIETLETQLEDLPDYEKTAAFEDLLLLLTDKLQEEPGIYTPAQ